MLPPGSYTIEYGRGPEYRTGVKKLAITGPEQKEVTFQFGAVD